MWSGQGMVERRFSPLYGYDAHTTAVRILTTSLLHGKTQETKLCSLLESLNKTAEGKFVADADVMKAIIFTRTKKTCEWLARVLKREGYVPLRCLSPPWASTTMSCVFDSLSSSVYSPLCFKPREGTESDLRSLSVTTEMQGPKPHMRFLSVASNHASAAPKVLHALTFP